MPFGDFVQSKANGGTATNNTIVTLDATATSGNLLVGVMTYRSDRVLGATPAGWTFVSDFQRAVEHSSAADQAYYYKVSDGTEDAATFRITAGGYLAAAIIELEGPWPADPTDVESFGDDDAVKSVSTGTTAETAVADSVAVAWGSIHNAVITDPPAWTNSFVARENFEYPGSMQAATLLLASTQTVETTLSYATGAANKIDAAVAVFSGVAAASDDTPRRVIRSPRYGITRMATR